MPLRSKAQQAYMFSQHPEIAKRWADETSNMKDLPEKLHPQTNPKRHHLKKAGDGRFFQKAAEISPSGHFFRDHPGRNDGTYYEKTANEEMGYPDGGMSDEGETPNASSEAGGGMYGTGKPAKNHAEESKLKALLGKAGPGHTRSAVKAAAQSPSDWEADIGIPTGFHRPAHDQPQALEAGGERFHSTLSKAPEASSGPLVRHGVVEGGSLSLPAAATSQLGKHAAAPRFLGTSFAKQALSGGDWENAKNYASERFNEAKSSVEGGAEDLAGLADKGVKAITQSPVATALAGGLLLRGAGRGAKGVARGIGHAFGRRPIPKPTGGMLGGLRRVLTGR